MSKYGDAMQYTVTVAKEIIIDLARRQVTGNASTDWNRRQIS